MVYYNMPLVFPRLQDRAFTDVIVNSKFPHALQAPYITPRMIVGIPQKYELTYILLCANHCAFHIR